VSSFQNLVVNTLNLEIDRKTEPAKVIGFSDVDVSVDGRFFSHFFFAPLARRELHCTEQTRCLGGIWSGREKVEE
jgi:hypothetical protein